jgi:multiple antibiotic resistance protein
MPLKDVKNNINRAVFVAGLLLFVFLFFGLRIFGFFNINLDSFQIAGGIILLIIGILYVLGITNKFVKHHGTDLSVPIGTPLLTGPGVITTTIILVKENGIFVAVSAAFLVLISTWLILINSPRIYRVLGEHWTNVISRVMGIILAAIAVEFIADGVLNILRPLI